jgi:multiple sugar transport system ATP-binding protein
LRAEHLRLHEAGGVAADGDIGNIGATVQRIERLSDQTLVHLALTGSDLTLTAAPPAGSTAAPGDSVLLQPRQPLWFDGDGQRIRA